MSIVVGLLKFSATLSRKCPSAALQVCCSVSMICPKHGEEAAQDLGLARQPALPRRVNFALKDRRVTTVRPRILDGKRGAMRPHGSARTAVTAAPTPLQIGAPPPPAPSLCRACYAIAMSDAMLLGRTTHRRETAGLAGPGSEGLPSAAGGGRARAGSGLPTKCRRPPPGPPPSSTPPESGATQAAVIRRGGCRPAWRHAPTPRGGGGAEGPAEGAPCAARCSRGPGGFDCPCRAAGALPTSQATAHRT
jgi:hypothetical protein